MEENKKESIEENIEAEKPQAEEETAGENNEPGADGGYDPDSYYEQEDVYDFVDDGTPKAKGNTGAKIAAFVIAVILIGTGVAAKVLLGKIGDIKQSREAPSGNVTKSAVTEIDSSEDSKDKKNDDDDDDDEDDEDDAVTDTSSDGLPDTVVPDSKEPKRYAAHRKDLSDLKEEVDEMIKYYPGDWSVYVQEMSTGASITIEDEDMYAASLIKLFAMAACYQRISDGKVNEDYAYDLIYRMITESDNNAFDVVVDLMGEDYFSEWLMQNGFWSTTYVHKLGDNVSYDGKRSPDGDNFTSAQDVGKLLDKIYGQKLVNKYYSDEMIKILKDQTKTEKIPAGLPEDVECANKTGETDNVCHDSAIVYSGGGDYILVVMAKDEGEAWVCDPFITDISRAVYEYFNTLAEDADSGVTADEYYDDETDLGDEEIPEYDRDIVYDDDEEEPEYENDDDDFVD